MTDIFLGFLNRSLAAGILILAVVLVRLVFKKGERRCHEERADQTRI